MSCGRIGLDDALSTREACPPRGAWFAECAIHEFTGPRRDRRAEALNDLIDHQARFAAGPTLRILAVVD